MDNCYIFSHGSLMLKREIERTLGRILDDDDIFPVTLQDHKRTWTAIRDNFSSDHKWLINRDTGIPPQFISYLNLTFDLGQVVEGMVFLIKKEELKLFDHREVGYQRVDVSSLIHSSKTISAPVFTYIDQCDNEFISNVYVSFHYLNLVRNACLELQSTAPNILINYLSATPIPDATLSDLDVIYFNYDYTELFELRLDRNPSKLQLASIHENDNTLKPHEDLITLLDAEKTMNSCSNNWRERFLWACTANDNILNTLQDDSCFLVSAAARNNIQNTSIKEFLKSPELIRTKHTDKQ